MKYKDIRVISDVWAPANLVSYILRDQKFYFDMNPCYDCSANQPGGMCYPK